jgi:uncharacterized protein with PhoU and TrkA domain
MPIAIGQMVECTSYSASDLAALVDTSGDATVKATLTKLEEFVGAGLNGSIIFTDTSVQLTASNMNKIIALASSTNTCKLPDTSTLEDGDMVLLALVNNNNTDIDDYDDNNLYTLSQGSDYVWLAHFDGDWIEMGRTIT